MIPAVLAAGPALPLPGPAPAGPALRPPPPRQGTGGWGASLQGQKPHMEKKARGWRGTSQARRVSIWGRGWPGPRGQLLQGTS